MTEKSELISDQAARLEARWELQGRKVTQLCEQNYKRYTERLKFVSQTALDQVSGALEILPCPSCVAIGQGKNSEEVEVTRLLVTMEPHPMHTGSVINAVCHCCGFQQMWPFKSLIGVDYGQISATALDIQAISQARMKALHQKAAAGMPEAIPELSNHIDQQILQSRPPSPAPKFKP